MLLAEISSKFKYRGAAHLSTEIVERELPNYRSNIRKLWMRFKTDLFETVKKEGPKFLLKEIRKLPIPLLPNLFATTLEKTLDIERGNDRVTEEILDRMDKMQISNNSFKAQLEKLGYIFSEWVQDQAHKEEGGKPRLIITNPIKRALYPILDNELRMVLSNPGQGSAIVEEIFLDVEKFEPCAKVDYSMPAAPLPMLFLKVHLSVDERNYPLLSLNEEPERIFYAGDKGAEKVIINISSKHNAEYWVRLRIPYCVTATGQKETVYYPELGKEAITLSYSYAPAWTNNIEPENLLARSEIYENFATLFKQIRLILQDCVDLSIRSREEIYKKLSVLGIDFVWGLGAFLRTFISKFLSIAYLEKRQDLIPTILRLIMLHEDLFPQEDPLTVNMEELARLAGNMEIKPSLERFAEESLSGKQQIFREIQSKILPLS